MITKLDTRQRHAVDRPAATPLLVLGEAGHGKTTVALHRLARLRREGGPHFRALVIVPVEGLRRFSELELAALSATVPVVRYERWALRQARRAFDTPRRASREVPFGVLALKRHPSVRSLFGGLPRRTTGRGDLLALFGDRERLEQLGPEVERRWIGVTLEHTHAQFERSAEDEWSHVTDRERLHTLDGRRIDEGTPTEDAATLDAEDAAVLFALDRLRGKRRVPRRYDAIVIDEAQELAPLELALIGRCLAPKGSLIVAGDAAQQIDATAWFGGWAATMGELGASGHETVVLEASYRCPPDLVAFARFVLDPTRERPRAGAAVRWRRVRDEPALVRALAKALSAPGEGPSAIVCRTPELAHTLAAALPDTRLVLDGRFSLQRAWSVTTVDQVRGLTLERVIVPDATVAAYPDTPEARRYLYLAVTRARTSASVFAAGRASPLVAPLLA